MREREGEREGGRKGGRESDTGGERMRKCRCEYGSGIDIWIWRDWEGNISTSCRVMSCLRRVMYGRWG